MLGKLDDDDRALVGLRRGEHMRAGFALQLVTVRWLGTFLEDPLNVPGEVLDFMAGQLGMADPSQVKKYTEWAKTRFDHQREIRRACGYRELSEAEAEFSDVARSIPVVNWHLLADPAARFTDLGHGYYQARLDTDRKLKSHIRQIQGLGFDVTLTKAA